MLSDDFTGFVRDDIDFARHLANAEQKALVISAGAYVDDLVASFKDGAGVPGDPLPWPRLQGRFELRPRELTEWVGYKGHAKSAVLSDVMLAQVARGRRVLKVSPEFTGLELLRRAVKQSAGGDVPADRYIRGWCAWANKRLYIFDKQSQLSPDLVLGVVAYAINELGANHVLVDSLLKCGIGEDDYNGQKRFVDRLQHLAHASEDAHIHLVAHARKGASDLDPPNIHDARGSGAIVDLAENVIVVHMNKRKQVEKEAGGITHFGEPDVTLTVEAQRNMPHGFGRYGLWFAPGLRFAGKPEYRPPPYFRLETQPEEQTR